MSWETCKNSLDYYFSHSSGNISIDFSGGEPLLNFELIKKAVEYSNLKLGKSNGRKQFSIITNGSLITDEIISFFDNNRFDIQFSFDSILQNKQRKAGSFKKSLIILEKLIEKKNITLSISPVFTSENAEEIFNSMMFLKKKNFKNLIIGLDLSKRWNIQSRIKLKNELTKLMQEEINNYKNSGKILFNIFSDIESNGIGGCSAGNPQFSISPSGDIWGCPSFTHLNWSKIKNEKASDYFYGNINDSRLKNIEKNFKFILNNYKNFRTDNFYTSKSKCFLCPYLHECKLCPAINKNSEKKNKSLYFIPEYICEINKILHNSNREFINSIKKYKL